MRNCNWRFGEFNFKFCLFDSLLSKFYALCSCFCLEVQSKATYPAMIPFEGGVEVSDTLLERRLEGWLDW